MVLREKKIKGGMKDMSEKKLPRVTPEEVGVESAAIGKMLDGFEEKGVGVHG